MNFGRRNAKTQPQAVPASPMAETPVASQEPRRNPIAKYIEDSYNGLYKILLEPSMPSKSTVALLVTGLLVGLLWGYGLAPIEFAGANPHRLNQSARDQWVLMAAGNYDRLFYDESETSRLLAQIENPAGTIERLLQSAEITPSDRDALLRIQPFAQNIVGTPAPADPGFFSNLFNGLLLPVILLVVLTIAFVLIWNIFIYSNFVAPFVERMKEMRDPVLKARNDANRADLRRLKEQRAELDRLKSEHVTDEELGEPVVQLLKVYQSGRAYDESNEIEVGEEFLGQCGSLIPDLLNGDPLAVEVWLFDMQATNEKNFKSIFVTEAAAADSQLIARLMDDSGIGPNNIAVIKPGAKLIVEGETLRLQNEISALEIAPNGRINSFRMKVSAWRKKVGAGLPAYTPAPVPAAAFNAPAPAPLPQAMPPSPAPIPATGFSGFSSAPRPLGAPADPAPLRPLSDYDNIEFDPPPVMPARPQTASPFGQPSAPGFPPPVFPPPEDDDPFGNTGDFTPLPPRR